MKVDLAILKNKIGSSLAAGDARAAKPLAVRLCKKNPKDVQSWVYLASTCLRLGEFADAEEAGRRAIKLDNRDSHAHLAVVHALLHQRKLPAAVIALKRLLTFFPEMVDARRQLAELLGGLGDFAGAEHEFKTVLDAKPGDAAALLGLLRVLRAAGRLEDAEAMCQSPACGHKISPELAVEYALIFSLRGQSRRAESTLREALVSAPNHPVLLNSLGELYQGLNRFMEAMDCYREALGTLPHAAGLHINLGRALQNQGGVESAIECYRRALELDAGNAAAHHNLGICLYTHEDPRAALAEFTKAIEIDPDLALARVYAAILYSRLGDTESAETGWQRIREHHPERSSILDSHAYMQDAAPDARTFSLLKPILTFAVQQAGEEGLVLEFGVFHGYSIGILAQAAQQAVHGFDSFQGLPSAWKVDSSKEVVEAAGTYTLHGELPPVPDNVELHVGWFEDTLPGFLEAHPEPVRLLHIDCDLYDSTVTIFAQLASRIKSGTVIVFDEYLCYPNWREDEYRAFQEFIARSKLDYDYIAYSLFTGQAVVRIR